MKILHTSDWHLGRTLYGRQRYDEFEAFLNWLLSTIQQEKIDVLLVAGDVFDTNTPSNRAQALYYRFLCQVANSCCRHVVIAAGNHDSPSFLNAPKELLKALNVHVIGATSGNLADEVLLLRHADDTPALFVCAVPYLRDRDIRQVEAGENFEDKERKLSAGIRQHYAAVVALAEQQRAQLGVTIPIVATGHLFAAGGQTIDGDGVRDLYIGSLAHVTADIFPESLAYVALGHLHVPQKVGGVEHKRYSGSPIAMGFGEAKQQKVVCLVDLANAQISLCNVPVFQRLQRIQGDWDALQNTIKQLKSEQQSIWLEVIYDGEAIKSDLREALEELTHDSQLEILRIKNNRIINRVLNQMQQQETLDDLDVYQVFERCLQIHDVPAEQRVGLLYTYKEAVQDLLEAEKR